MTDSQQSKARRVFGEPSTPDGQWRFTERGLQQVTQEAVARVKASWFGQGLVVDLCCGLGGDTIAIARRGDTIGIDKDHELLRLTAHNLEVAGVTATLHCIDVVSSEIADIVCEARWLHIDPDRRADGKRHTAAHDLQPSWTRVCDLLIACDGGIVKLAPATALPEQSASHGHRLWISTRGEVREQSYLFGEILQQPALPNLLPGGTSSLIIRNEKTHWFVGSKPDCTNFADRPARWIIDPDAAIRAAGLTESFAERFGLLCIGGPSGFLTSDQESLAQEVFRFAKVSEVIVVMSCQEKRWRAELRARSAFPSTIKVRGTHHEPAALVRKLRSCGEHPVTLWIGRTSTRGYAVIAHPLV